MDSGKKEYTFLWFIENYSYCCLKNGKALFSPKFCTDSLEGTAWNLHLYPRGESYESKGWISLYLSRSNDDAGPELVSVRYEFSVLAADGSTLLSRELEATFQKVVKYGCQFLKIDLLSSSRKAKYLPQDTLSVRCKIWKGFGEIQPQAQISARTRIGIEQISFFHVTENFSMLEPNQKQTRDIKIDPKEGHTLTCSLYLSDCFCCDEKIMVQITTTNVKHILSRCYVSILDKSCRKIECLYVENHLYTTGKRVQILSLPLIKWDILRKRREYLIDDKLNLLCECSFSAGVEYEKIEKIVLDDYNVINNAVHSLRPGTAVLKCLFAAIFSGLFGIFVAYLTG